jgi:cell wall-associated NlpC family hydrolase
MTLALTLVAVPMIAPAVFAERRSVIPEWVRHLQRAPAASQFAAQSTNLPNSSDRAREPVAPANPVAAQTAALVQQITGQLRSTRYNHQTVVDERAGRYEFDCSGLVAWILRRTAPDALAAIHSRRPVAAEITATIRRAPTDHASHGWQRIERLEDARPGDVFAWQNPAWLRGATGHTGFILGPITPVIGRANLFHVRIADANGSGYADDTRPAGSSGVGIGTSVVSTNPTTGAVNGLVVGWLGDWWILPLSVEIGRVSR